GSLPLPPAIRDGGRDRTQPPQIQPPQPRATMTGGYRHRPDRPAPEFDKGTLARTLIGLYGQVTSLPDRPESLRVLAPCQIPALSALSPRTHLRSPADAGKADIVRQAATRAATARDIPGRRLPVCCRAGAALVLLGVLRA